MGRCVAERISPRLSSWAVELRSLFRSPDTLDRRSVAVVDPANLVSLLGNGNATTVAAVPTTALGVPAVYRAVAMISSSVSQLPWASWNPRTNVQLPEQPTILRRPDPFMARARTLYRVTSSMLLHGEAFLRLAAPGRDGRATVAIPLPPDEVQITWNRDRTRPEYRWRSGPPLAEGREIMHIRYMEIPGVLRGIGPIQSARWTVTGALASEQHAAEFFTDGAIPDAVLESPSKLTKPEAERLRDQWNETDGGRRSTAVLSGGVEYKPITMSNADAQFVESRNFNVGDVARLFGIPAPLLNAQVAGSSLTYRNTEGVMTEYGTFAVLPVTEPIEAGFGELIPTTQELRFSLTRLLRADSKTRFEVYQLGLTNGVLTVNEVREIEGLAQLAGGGPVPEIESSDPDDAEVPV